MRLLANEMSQKAWNIPERMRIHLNCGGIRGLHKILIMRIMLARTICVRPCASGPDLGLG